MNTFTYMKDITFILTKPGGDKKKTLYAADSFIF